MPDPSPSPTDKTPKPRGAVNAEYTRGLDKTEQVIAAANDPAYAPQILAGDITPQFIADLAADTQRARDFLASAVSKRGTRKDATREESAERLALARAMQGIQTRAMQKYHATDPNRPRDTYYVGTSLSNAADPLLLQIADAVLLALQSDVLPGVDAARITGLQSALEEWKTSVAAQGAQGGAALTDFAQFKLVFDATEARRRTIQFAADDDFPFYEPVNKAAREAFKLPPKAPFRG